jgi:phage tail-like protein
MVFSPPRGQDSRTPFGNFAFHVNFVFRPDSIIFGAGGDGGLSTSLLGGFAEISGLEASMEHKVIKEGGRNYGAIMRAGPTSFGTVILKRGIVSSRHLWRWWSMFAGADGANDALPEQKNRCDVLIGLIQRLPSSPVQQGNRDGTEEVAHSAKVAWKLVNAMPVKFKIGDLNAKGSDIAVEEIHLVHEGLNLEAVA